MGASYLDTLYKVIKDLRNAFCSVMLHLETEDLMSQKYPINYSVFISWALCLQVLTALPIVLQRLYADLLFGESYGFGRCTGGVHRCETGDTLLGGSSSDCEAIAQWNTARESFLSRRKRWEEDSSVVY